MIRHDFSCLSCFNPLLENVMKIINSKDSRLKENKKKTTTQKKKNLL